MAEESVLCTDGGRRDALVYSLKCPCCGAQIVPNYLCFHYDFGILFCSCPVTGCGEFFLARFWGGGLVLVRNHPLSKQVFSDIIENVSSSFVKIYNEAYAAEQMDLMEVCGVGYRKALEFLIKDYAIQDKDEQTVKKIKKKLLMQCIDDHVDDAMVKAVAKRAVWLWNDETHYVRKWEEKRCSSFEKPYSPYNSLDRESEGNGKAFGRNA